jgi:hypothetical protein
VGLPRRGVPLGRRAGGMRQSRFVVGFCGWILASSGCHRAPVALAPPVALTPRTTREVAAAAVPPAPTPRDLSPRGPQLASACGRTCAARAGRVWCWARAAGAPLAPAALAGITDARALACGDAHCCAARAGGDVVCWSAPQRASPLGAPVALALPEGQQVAALAAGGATVCAALHSGRVACWRWRRGAFTPARMVDGVEGAAAVAVGVGHACALVADGQVRCWGATGAGQVGVATAHAAAAPVAVPDLPPAIALSAGARHTCARTAAGEVWCWGDNARGQLGRGPFAGGARPQRVIDLTGVEAITAGRAHSCAVLAGGAVACWGDNRGREVGAIAPALAPVPVPVPGMLAAELSGACAATCARRADGTVACWGAGYRAPGLPTGRPLDVALP